MYDFGHGYNPFFDLSADFKMCKGSTRMKCTNGAYTLMEVLFQLRGDVQPLATGVLTTIENLEGVVRSDPLSSLKNQALKEAALTILITPVLLTL
jgi:hypothetical protein